MVSLSLDRMEMLIASVVGAARNLQADSFTNRRHATNKSDWYIDVDGAMGEMVFAKWLGVYWGGSNLSLHGPDVGEGWRVRSTDLEHGMLIIRPRDKPKVGDTFVLVITTFKPEFRIAGFIAAKDGCIDAFKREDAWWIPQERLEQFDLRGGNGEYQEQVEGESEPA